MLDVLNRCVKIIWSLIEKSSDFVMFEYIYIWIKPECSMILVGMWLLKYTEDFSRNKIFFPSNKNIQILNKVMFDNLDFDLCVIYLYLCVCMYLTSLLI